MNEDEHIYHIIITKRTHKTSIKFTGELQIINTVENKSFPFNHEEKVISLPFDPLTILDDLRNKKIPLSYYGKRLNLNTTYKNYEYEYAFDTPIYIGNNESYLMIVNAIDRVMRLNLCKFSKKTIQKELENIFEIETNFSFKIQNIKQITFPNRKKNIELYENITPQHEQITSLDTLTERDYCFVYECFSPSDIICSILHFISFHGFQFKTCYHCQKRYVYIKDNKKRKYCHRTSPIFSSPSCYFKDDKNFKDRFKNCTCQKAAKQFSSYTQHIINNKIEQACNKYAKKNLDIKCDDEDVDTEISKMIRTDCKKPTKYLTVNDMSNYLSSIKNYTFSYEER